jgi:NAD(P)-dependent dehydrogenase (short-subunit alcohol dehydrogenase family)
LSDVEIAESNAQMEKTVPVGRRGSPEEVARWIRHLAGRDAAWVTGSVVRVDGGLFL